MGICYEKKSTHMKSGFGEAQIELYYVYLHRSSGSRGRTKLTHIKNNTIFIVSLGNRENTSAKKEMKRQSSSEKKSCLSYKVVT